MQSPSCSLEEDPESGVASFGSSGEDNNKDNKDKDEPPPLDCSDDRNKTMKDRKSEKKRKSNSNSNSNSRRLRQRRRHTNHDNEYEYEQEKRDDNDNDNNEDDKNDRRIKRYLQRFHKGITDTDTDTAADNDDDEINNNNACRPKNNKQKNNMILLKDCLNKLLFTGAGISEISSCLFLASSSDNHDAVTLILEQITKWNNNSNTKKKKHTKNKKHKKHKDKKNNSNNKYSIIDIDDLINGTNNNSSDSMLTPLHIACLLNNGGMASILVQYGANKYARDANGDTPFDDLGLDELITQHENSLLRTEAKERANQRDHSQQQELQKEQTVRDMEWSKKLADVEAQDQMQHGTGTAEQKFGTGWDDTTTNDVLNEAGGHSDGDWWSRIAKERKQKKQKHQRTAEKAAASAFAFAAFAASSNKKRSHSNISGDDDGNGGNGDGDGKSTNNNESSSDNNRKKDTAGTTTGPSSEIKIIDPREARAIDNRAWSAFIEKWSTAAAAAPAPAVVVATNKTTTLKTTATTTEGAATSSPLSSSSSLLLGTETKDDPILMQSNRRTMMTMTDVPWPCMGDEIPFPGGSSQSSPSSVSLLTQGERKVYHRQLIRRWHPDKFLQRFHSHLQTNEKEKGEKDDDNRMATRILKRVTAVFQSINNNMYD